MLFTLDDATTPPSLRYSYFEQAEPFVETNFDTYVPTDVRFTQGLSKSWNHGMGEIFTALLDAGLAVTQFLEHDSVPWNALPGQMSLDSVGEWRLSDAPQRLAASFTIQASKL
jgi:hypothetical protein